MYAISVSTDRKWVVCSTGEGASIWDAEIQEKVADVEDRNSVNAVDVSPDSTTFATGADRAVSIWLITSGRRPVGPVKHDFYVTAVRFSPDGERIATASHPLSLYTYTRNNLRNQAQSSPTHTAMAAITISSRYSFIFLSP